MSGPVSVVLLLTAVAVLAGALWATRVIWFAHRRQVAVERVKGNLALRRRMAGMAGNRLFPDTQATVTKAETMHGWVWIRAVRRDGKFTEQHGWAMTRRGAQRRLDKAGKPRTPRR